MEDDESKLIHKEKTSSPKKLQSLQNFRMTIFYIDHLIGLQHSHTQTFLNIFAFLKLLNFFLFDSYLGWPNKQIFPVLLSKEGADFAFHRMSILSCFQRGLDVS